MPESNLSTAGGLRVGRRPVQKWPRHVWLSAPSSENYMFCLPNYDHLSKVWQEHLRLDKPLGPLAEVICGHVFQPGAGIWGRIRWGLSPAGVTSCVIQGKLVNLSERYFHYLS